MIAEDMGVSVAISAGNRAGIQPTHLSFRDISPIILAGPVLGNAPVKVPILGKTLVPHPSYVGSYFCKKRNCAEMVVPGR